MIEEKEVFEKICPICGKAFLTPWWHKKYCSTACADLENRERKRRRKKKSPAAVRRSGSGSARKKPEAITWDEIRAVLAEEGISNYHEAVRIAEQRRREAEEEWLKKAFEKEMGEEK